MGFSPYVVADSRRAHTSARWEQGRARNWYLLATEANLVALHLLTIILAKFRRNCAASPSSLHSGFLFPLCILAWFSSGAVADKLSPFNETCHNR